MHRRNFVRSRPGFVVLATSFCYLATWDDCAAQQLIATIPQGTGPIDSIGDVDGDGRADILYSTPENSGVVSIRRGTGEPILEVASGIASTFLGEVLSGVGDLDLDGVPDFLARANEQEARAYSGATGALLFTALGPPGTTLFAQAIDEVGDIDHDGRPDFAVSSPHSAWICSGAGGVVLRSFLGLANDGVNLAGIGDVDLDGVGDLAVAAPHASAISGFGGPGLLRVYSSATAALLLEREGSWPQATLGRALSRVGDIDLDGVPDLLISSLTSTPTGLLGRVEVLSLPSGVPLNSLTGFEPGGDGVAGDQFGDSLDGIGDIDGDGRPELLVGAAALDWIGAGDGGAFVYGGLSGTPLEFTLCPLSSNPFGEFWGRNLSGVGDVDGDGVRDFVIGSPEFLNPGGPGNLRVYSGIGNTVTPYGQGCGGSGGFVPRLTLEAFDEGLAIGIENGVGGATTLLFAGTYPGHASLGYGCSLWVQPPLSSPLTFTLTGTGPGNGSAHFAIHLPPALEGLGMMQAFLVDPGTPGGFAATAAKQVAVH